MEEPEEMTILVAASASRDRLIYRTSFFGTNIFTTVTSRPYVVKRWINSTVSHISHGIYSKIIGLGVQWETFHGSDPAATLQICVWGKCLIFQLHHATSVPRALRRFLYNPNYTFIGLWNRFDAQRLANCRFRLQMGSLPVDARHYARTQQGLSLRQSPVEIIARECFGYQGSALHHAILFSRWESHVLNTHQVEHATIDPYAAYLLGERALNLN